MGRRCTIVIKDRRDGGAPACIYHIDVWHCHSSSASFVCMCECVKGRPD